jgi:hypothetical protein
MSVRRVTVLAGLAGLAALAVAAAAAVEVKPQAPGPPSGPTSVVRQEFEYDIFAENQKVGRLRLRIMTVSDRVILDEEFLAQFKGQETGFDTQEVYRDGAKPVPQRAKAVTRFGDVKLMEGSITFEAKDGGPLSAKMEATGYADKERKPLAKAATVSKEVAVPEGTVLTHGALLYFAPRLLPAAGQKDKIVFMELPDDIDFPALVNFKPDCVLSRSAPNAEGNFEFLLKQVLAGGNAVPLATITMDEAGHVIETRLGRYAIRPHKAETPAKSPEARPAPPR